MSEHRTKSQKLQAQQRRFAEVVIKGDAQVGYQYRSNELSGAKSVTQVREADWTQVFGYDPRLILRDLTKTMFVIGVILFLLLGWYLVLQRYSL